MTMIGSKADATRAFNREVPAFSREGSSRVVYLIDGVIYKIDRGAWSNDDEWANYKRLTRSNLPDYLAIPKMNRYVVNGQSVIAAEYIDGTKVGECFERWIESTCDGSPECLPESVENVIKGYIEDAVYGNVIVSNGVYYLVDIEN